MAKKPVSPEPLSFVEIVMRADAETIKDTAIAQPLLVAAGLLAGEALTRSVPFTGVDVLAGLAAGERVALGPVRAGLTGALPDGPASSGR